MTSSERTCGCRLIIRTGHGLDHRSRASHGLAAYTCAAHVHRSCVGRAALTSGRVQWDTSVCLQISSSRSVCPGPAQRSADSGGGRNTSALTQSNPRTRAPFRAAADRCTGSDAESTGGGGSWWPSCWPIVDRRSSASRSFLLAAAPSGSLARGSTADTSTSDVAGSQMAERFGWSPWLRWDVGVVGTSGRQLVRSIATARVGAPSAPVSRSGNTVMNGSAKSTCSSAVRFSTTTPPTCAMKR